MISAEVLKKDQPHIEDVELEGAAGGQGCVSTLVPGMLYTNGCVSIHKRMKLLVVLLFVNIDISFKPGVLH